VLLNVSLSEKRGTGTFKCKVTGFRRSTLGINTSKTVNSMISGELYYIERAPLSLEKLSIQDDILTYTTKDGAVHACPP
jgi:hypothetical protein